MQNQLEDFAVPQGIRAWTADEFTSSGWKSGCAVLAPVTKSWDLTKSKRNGPLPKLETGVEDLQDPAKRLL